MIDDLRQVSRLLVKLEESLPVTVTLTAQAAVALHGQSSGVRAPTKYQVRVIHYLGHLGGIICGLDDRSGEGRGEFLVSITDLEFDRRQPIACDVANYQGQRRERLRHLASGECLADGCPGQTAECES